MQSANPRLIGTFVLGGIGLLVGLLLTFGSGEVFKETNTYYSVFQGTTRGLSIGSEVNFRGVKIGQVSGVYALVASQEVDVLVQVVYDIDPTVIRDPESLTAALDELGDAEYASYLIGRGLRARLETQSLLTGLKVIDLDFYPDSELLLSGMPSAYPEIPTLRTAIEELAQSARGAMDAAKDIPIRQISEELLEVLETMNGILNSRELESTFASAEASFQSIEGVSRSVENEIETLVNELELTLQTSRQTLERVDKTLVAVEDMLATVERTLTTVEQSFSDESPMQAQAAETLEEIRDTARAFRVLADYLEQHPEALLTGKGDPE